MSWVTQVRYQRSRQRYDWMRMFSKKVDSNVGYVYGIWSEYTDIIWDNQVLFKNKMDRYNLANVDPYVDIGNPWKPSDLFDLMWDEYIIY